RQACSPDLGNASSPAPLSPTALAWRSTLAPNCRSRAQSATIEGAPSGPGPLLVPTRPQALRDDLLAHSGRGLRVSLIRTKNRLRSVGSQRTIRRPGSASVTQRGTMMFRRRSNVLLAGANAVTVLLLGLGRT